jgi:hypothetical protein
VLAVISTFAACNLSSSCEPAWVGITVSNVLLFASVPLAGPFELSVIVFTLCALTSDRNWV